jgi:hypothetical protein
VRLVYHQRTARTVLGIQSLCYNGSVQKVLVIGLFTLIAYGASSANSQPIAAQQALSVPCVHFSTELQYPAVALDNRIMGLVTTTFDTDENGEILRLEATGHPLLTVGAIAALRSAHFSSGCLGHAIVVRLSFRIDQDLDPHTPTAVKVISSDQYEIVAPAQTIEVTNYDPAWIFSRKGGFLHRLSRWLSKLRFW